MTQHATLADSERIPTPETASRVRQLSADEQRVEAERVAAVLAAISAGMRDPSDDFDWAEAERELDSFRPHRPLFAGPASE